jgi:diguanylate cyclase (GGDEF)-like protein
MRMAMKPLARLPILLVEDNPGDADLVRELLSGNAAVTHVFTLAEAIQAARQRVFYVALVDASLPDAQGVTAIDALAQIGAFPVILLTATDSSELGKAAAQSGAQDYLLKGQFKAPQLLRAISSAVYRHESVIQYRTLLRESPDGVLIVSQNGVIQFANPAAVRAFEVEVDSDLVGTPIETPLIGEDSAEITLRNGRTMELRVGRVPWRGEDAHLMVLRDITERVRLVAALAATNKKLAELSVIDPLTGVLNRRGIEEALNRIIHSSNRGAGRAIALLFDCDNFKNINTVGGYAAGDATLQLVANTLASAVRVSLDCVGRIGGDEFLVLLPDTRFAEGLLVAERLREMIRRKPLPLSAHGHRSEVTVSVGAVSIPHTAASLKEVIELAESALLSSKSSGKDRVTAGRADIDDTGGHGADVREILATPDTIRMVAQPIVSQPGALVIGHELLFRGRSGGLLESPMMFFAAARRQNLLAAADLACLRRGIEASSHLANSGRVHLNVFPSTILDTPLEELLSICAGATRLVLELSEQEFVGDPALLVPAIAAFKRADIRIALDDVGFGRSSLETILVLEPHIIKIDRCMVHGIAENAGQRRIFKRLLQSLAGLGTEIIAEGIETETDAKVVFELGVPFAQGFLWGRPEPVHIRKKSKE